MNKINYSELNVDDIGDPNISPQERHEFVTQTISKAKRGEEVPVEFIIKLHPKNPFIKFNETDTLFSVMETLGNGVHRIAITNEEGNKITGILSQRRLIKYMWENARRFPSLDFYLTSTLQDLKIGSSNPITIYEDQMLIEALHKMFNERVSSLAVIDRSRTLIGNISIVDVKIFTSSKNSHLLFKSVLNFISYNLSQKGIEEGQDQFPIFHVNNQTSLGRVIAKLVATQSHRLWIVDSSRQASSMSSASACPNSGMNNGVTVGYPAPVDSSITDKAEEVEASSMSSPQLNAAAAAAAVATGAPTTATSAQPDFSYTSGTGKLVGVVTLTDILGLFATSKGRRTDPQAARNQRRRSSTSTTRSSIDSALSAEGILPSGSAIMVAVTQPTPAAEVVLKFLVMFSEIIHQGTRKCIFKGIVSNNCLLFKYIVVVLFKNERVLGFFYSSKENQLIVVYYIGDLYITFCKSVTYINTLSITLVDLKQKEKRVPLPGSISALFPFVASSN